MANVYVRSGAAGAGTGADWANAFTTLAAAFSGKAAGDVFWVSEDHAETQASAMTLTSPGTSATPCFVYCVNHGGSVPPVSADLRTTATISVTGAFNMTWGAQATYWYGIIFQGGSAANASSLIFVSAATTQQKFQSCGFSLLTTSTSGRFNMSSGGGIGAIKLEFIGCTFTFGSSTSQQFVCGSITGVYRIIGGSMAVGANVPTTVFVSMPAVLELIGVDLSAFGSGKTLIGASSTSTRVLIQDCKLGASVTVAATPTTVNQDVYLARSDSSGTSYRHEKYHYAGTQTVETTIVRTGGATDGTTPIAAKIVTTANSKWVAPFECVPIAIWNDVSGSSVTCTVCGIWGGGAAPNNDDIWMEVEYLGAAGNPQATIATTTKADNLATGSATTADSSTWGGSTTKFKMAATFTPQQKGALLITVKAALASSTFYVDPLAVLT